MEEKEREGFGKRIVSLFGRVRITDEDLRDYYNIALFLVLIIAVMNITLGLFYYRNNFIIVMLLIVDLILILMLIMLKGILIRLNVMLEKVK